MIQLNLLPDVKLEFLRSSRQKRLVTGIALLATIVSIAAVLLLASVVYVLQKKSLDDLNDDIATYNSQLKQKSDLDKVLTVQNQLNTLPGLHNDKPVASRLFSYLTQLTPTAASVSQFDINFVEKQMTITGSASSLDVANTFIDTLKFTTFNKVEAASDTAGSASNAKDTEDAKAPPPKAFSNVVLSQFTRNPTTANYTITLTYDEAIFNSESSVVLVVPRITSSRSTTEQPVELFQKQGSTTTVNPPAGTRR